ncbi:hypothetical protein Vi05172_g1680 [Venturia inaequalis]|uniref:SET domain-containing protein n=1 Tax=Venturia inaequalis TaxID=5025 RepID=A0A8H3VUR1_VENIN|nr:hypothetical protein EG327_008043 [Venturia inaequalis]RDI87839.1 hypothetical protein Vi05172_g1680 [Venturia inaequalis]
MAENADVGGSIDARHLIDIRSIGDNNIASYAKTNISKGTCVLAEAPLLISSTGADDDIFKGFYSITDSQQEAYLKLCCIPTMSTVKDWDPAGALGRKIAAIYNTNVFYTGEVYEQASRFNHSCSPNLTHIVRNGKRMFYARRDIKVDEEMTISYIDESSSLEKRKFKLLHWLFDCQCVACNGSPKSNQMEQKRLEIKGVDLKMNDYPDVLSIAPSPDAPSDDQLQSLLALHEKKIGLLDELSIRPWDLSQSYAKASKCCLMLRNQGRAIAYKGKQVEVLKANFGEEDDVFRKVSVQLEALKADTSLNMSTTQEY